MANQPVGAQPAPHAERAAEIAAGEKAAATERRDKFTRAFASALLQAKPNSTPGSLARAVVPLVDAFIAQLDIPTGN